MDRENETHQKITLMGILNDLNLNLSTNPRGTDKGDYKTYVSGFYEKEFSFRRLQKNRLLEVGIRSGASMALWANFFKDAELVGLDVEDVGTSVGPLAEYLDYPAVTFYCNDAYDIEFASSINGMYTIMIDDGPHSLSSQVLFIELYLSKLAKDGVLIVEDVQGGYRDIFQLMNSLPNTRYKFEIYDFTANGSYDDMLFVVRHNEERERQIFLKTYVAARCALQILSLPLKKAVRFVIRSIG